MTSKPPELRVVLFDGVCNLCNSSINFIIDADKKNRYKFAALQSKSAQELLKSSQVDPSQLDSVVLYDRGRVYSHSAAILHIGKYLGFPYNLGVVFLIVPRFIRDFFYNIIARNRYRWFGKQDACRVPTPELKEKFLP